jgi:hypothetical protein
LIKILDGSNFAGECIYAQHKTIYQKFNINNTNKSPLPPAGTLALCMLLRRLSYPNRLVDLANFFNYSSQSLSHIISTMANFIVENHGHLLENLNAHQWLNRNRYQLYAQVILLYVSRTPLINMIFSLL